MDDYINREDALKLCRDGKLLSSNAFEKLAIKYIADIPSADVRPVKHGRWELGKSGNDFIGYPVYNCSVCGYWNEDVYGFLYCPNCGARMDGEE